MQFMDRIRYRSNHKRADIFSLFSSSARHPAVFIPASHVIGIPAKYKTFAKARAVLNFRLNYTIIEGGNVRREALQISLCVSTL